MHFLFQVIFRYKTCFEASNQINPIKLFNNFSTASKFPVKFLTCHKQIDIIFNPLMPRIWFMQQQVQESFFSLNSVFSDLKTHCCIYATKTRRFPSIKSLYVQISKTYHAFEHAHSSPEQFLKNSPAPYEFAWNFYLIWYVNVKQ